MAVPRQQQDQPNRPPSTAKRLLRTLMASSGEPKVCAMAKPPSPEEEDRRRLGRERKTLIAGPRRTRQSDQGPPVPRKGLSTTSRCAATGPRLEALRTGAGAAVPLQLKSLMSRELESLELSLAQDEGGRGRSATRCWPSRAVERPARCCSRSRAWGPSSRAGLWLEGLFGP